MRRALLFALAAAALLIADAGGWPTDLAPAGAVRGAAAATLRPAWRWAPTSTCVWWQSISPAPAVVYDATCGTDLASSRTNWASPGTLDLAASQPAPPTWTATGWTMDGGAYLLTPITPAAGGGFTALASWRGRAPDGTTRAVVGSRGATDSTRVVADLVAVGIYSTNSRVGGPTIGASGVMGVSRGLLWHGGTSYAMSGSTDLGTGGRPLLIGAWDDRGTVARQFGAGSTGAQICAVLIWTSYPGAAAMTAASAAMAARCAP